jgi:enoyl-CoA hydratase
MVIETRDETGGVRVLILNRPPANAINAGLLQELERACGEAERDDAVRAVVLTGGAGKFFCGGLDLKAVIAAGGAAPWSVNLGRNDGVFALWTLSKPTVAMINGHAIAGGTILALACDVRIAAHGNAKIGLNEAAIGLAFPIGAFEIARLALTNQQARRVLLEAELHLPEAAREAGLVDEIVDPARLEEACLERARRLGAYPRAAFVHSKRALQHEAVERVRNETPAQQRAVVSVWTSEETSQVLAAQLAGISKGSTR